MEKENLENPLSSPAFVETALPGFLDNKFSFSITKMGFPSYFFENGRLR